MHDQSMRGRHRAAVLIPCGCGQCDKSIWSVDEWGKPRSFWPGHARYRPIEEKLWRAVYRDPNPAACWLRHTGNILRWQITDGEYTAPLAHRVAWELASGTDVPVGLDICHTCDVPGCVRNEPVGTYACHGVSYVCHGHLFAAPPLINMRDKTEKHRQARGEDNGGAKIDAITVLAIRDARDRGSTYDELVNSFGVSKSQIARIVRRQSWHHV